MVFNEIFEEINTWEYKPINELLEPGYRRNTTSLVKRIIMIGATQMGKTTLIMTLMGVLPNKTEELEKILRGGRRYGSSSTSTAIIYSKMPKDSENSDKFGLAKGEITKRIEERDVVFFSDSEQFKIALERINENSRKNSVKEKEDLSLITYVFIPNSYFESNSEEDLQIVDLPGFGDKNEIVCRKIKKTVEMLSDFIAGVVAVVSADKIQQLGSEYKSFIDNRSEKNLLIAVSYSISRLQKDIRKEAEAKETDKEKEEIIRKFYKDEIEKITNKELSERVFPIESKKWASGSEGSESLLNTVDLFTNSILKELKNMECKTSINACEDNLSEAIKGIETQIEKAKKEEEVLNESLLNYQEQEKKCCKIRDNKHKELYKLEEELISISNEIKKVSEAKAPQMTEDSFKEFYEYSDKSKRTKNELVGKLSGIIIERINKHIDSLELKNSGHIKACASDYVFNCCQISLECCLNKQKDERFIFKKTYGKKWAQMYADEINWVIYDAWTEAQNECEEILKKEEKDKNREIQSTKSKVISSDSSFRDAETKINHINDDISRIKSKMSQYESELKTVRMKKNHVTDTFIRHYNIKMSELGERIMKEKNPELKMALFLVQSTITYNMKGTIERYAAKEQC